jgi:hypothetical protein
MLMLSEPQIEIVMTDRQVPQIQKDLVGPVSLAIEGSMAHQALLSAALQHVRFLRLVRRQQKNERLLTNMAWRVLCFYSP